MRLLQLVALFALKTQQPDYVHILYRGSLDTLPQSSHLVVQLLTSMAQHLPFGAVLNQEVQEGAEKFDRILTVRSALGAYFAQGLI